MKIIRVSNYDYEDHRGNQRVVAEGITDEREARVMAEALQHDPKRDGEDWFMVVPDDHKLWRFAP